MEFHSHVLEKLYVEKLKGLKNVELDFSSGNLFAIMGVNGVGKSTILHALACCYKPPADIKGGDNHLFSEFFLPNTLALWNDSNFTITHSYKVGSKSFDQVNRTFKKQKRWTPKYSSRTPRFVRYFGIDSCVPSIEKDTAKSLVKLNLIDKTDQSSEIISYCRYILNIDYTNVALCKNGSGKIYLGVKQKDSGYYASLSMGSGEQRVFKLIYTACTCPSNSMILVDEIDLLLHDNALRRLIAKLSEIACKKHLQIIFTTHSMLMNELSKYVEIRYLIHTVYRTLVQTYISSDQVQELTGVSKRPLSIFVEDVLSEAIINKVCEIHGCKRDVSVFLFGAAANSIIVMAGFVFNNNYSLNNVAVIDGDVMKTEDEKKLAIQQKITGKGSDIDQKRATILDGIIQYALPDGKQPEEYIRECILGLPYNVLAEDNEIRIVLQSLDVVLDKHNYLRNAIGRLDLDNKVGYSKMIDLFACSKQWGDFVHPVEKWLSDRNLAHFR